MKVVFLDIDGVLNTPGNYHEYSVARKKDNENWADMRSKHIALLFDECCVSALNSITNSTGAKIVVSSSWRHFYDGRGGRPTFAELAELLRTVGVTAEVIGMTPTDLPRRFSESLPRGKEIKRWLEEHPIVEAFVILDDNNDMAMLRHKLVQTKGHIGLCVRDIDKALRHLGITRLSARRMHLQEAEVQHGEAVRRKAVRRGQASGSDGEEAGPDASRGREEA